MKGKASNKESWAEITASPVIYVIEHYKSQLCCKKHIFQDTFLEVMS